MLCFILLSTAFAQETAIDFDAVEINASAVRPSVQNMFETSRNLELNPMGFQEMCRAMVLESQLGTEYWLNFLLVVNSQHSRNFEHGEYGVCIISKSNPDDYWYGHWEVSDQYRKTRGLRSAQGNYVYHASSVYINGLPARDRMCDIFSVFSEDCYTKNTNQEIRKYLSYAWTYQQDQESGDILMTPDLTSMTTNHSKSDSFVNRRFDSPGLIHSYCGTEESCNYELPSIIIKAIDPSLIDHNESVYVFSSSYAEEGIVCLGTVCQEKPDFYGFLVLH